jgi:hypothetical protein
MARPATEVTTKERRRPRGRAAFSAERKLGGVDAR